MTLDELDKAVAELKQNTEGDTPIGIEICGYAYDLKSITVVVSSDLWESGTVVMVGDSDDGEADDG